MFRISGNPGGPVPHINGVPRHPEVAWIPISLALLCSEHLDVLLPGVSWKARLQPRLTDPNSHRCYVANLCVPESWQRLCSSSAKIWPKAAFISREPCASVPSLSRGAMSFSLILAFWKEQMVPRSGTSEPELQYGASCIIFISSRVSQTTSSLHFPLQVGWECQLNELMC